MDELEKSAEEIVALGKETDELLSGLLYYLEHNNKQSPELDSLNQSLKTLDSSDNNVYYEKIQGVLDDFRKAALNLGVSVEDLSNEKLKGYAQMQNFELNKRIGTGLKGLSEDLAEDDRSPTKH